ncbi:hypothetical protein DSM107010_51480 [Chroococcidiopsis cubana SAG 39.79]|uniref:Uncharacterized protein n=1 Tax=Chroococcidiopsis cubana SAG 39.79 TaxID=388085 RepID=A0AB37UD83_9CYAN|nr:MULTISPECIES: hypothetical protein [Chroococcidiopsis]RUT06900.1 hypothetical protein DSM107010_51480 [Chroococcidiopsis cubana SAG 39.79]
MSADYTHNLRWHSVIDRTKLTTLNKQEWEKDKGDKEDTGETTTH